MSKNANWQSTIDIVVGILDRHKVIMRNDAIFDRQAKEDLAADIIEKLDEIWHTDKTPMSSDELDLSKYWVDEESPYIHEDKVRELIATA